MSEIIKNKLYLGDLFNANNEREIKENNITCIICVAENLQIRISDSNIKIFNFNFQDNCDFNISLYFHEIGTIINDETTVLVNCVAGISRSSTIVIAYIMKYYNLNLIETISYVKNKRKQINPNKQFIRYLIEYEKKLFKKNSISFDECIKFLNN